MQPDGLTRVPKWAPSQRPYAFHVPTFKLDEPGHGSITAMWGGRKNGKMTLTLGTLRLWSHRVAFTGLDDAIRHADMRYGGQWQHQWNGERLLTETTFCLEPDEHAEMAEMLDAAYQSLPALPGADWDGWYYRRAA